MSAAARADASFVDTAPFDLGDAAAPAAALCLHGLTGTPYEVRSLGEALAGAGIRAVGPVLPGHDETPEALAKLSYRDWLEATRKSFRRLRSEHQQVFVVGLSLGGLLSLSLAASEPVEGIVVIGTPLRFRPTLRLMIPVLKYVMPFLKKSGGSDIRDAEARRRHPSYPVMPLASVHELLRLQLRVESELARITAPILVAHGQHDATAQLADAHAIGARVSSEQRRLLVLPDSGHVVPVDHGREQLARAVVSHLGALVRALGPSGSPRGVSC